MAWIPVWDLRNPADISRCTGSSIPARDRFHLAAQSLVRYGYDHPQKPITPTSWAWLICWKAYAKPPACVLWSTTTTDRVLRQSGTKTGLRWGRKHWGAIPTAAAKACSELVTAAVAQSLFRVDSHPSNPGQTLPIATARAGNVIGGTGVWTV